MIARRTALLLGALAAVLTAAQVALIALTWTDPAAAAYYWRPAALVQALIAFEFAMVGGLIALRRGDNRIGWLLLAGGVGLCVYSFCSEYALVGEVTAAGGLPWSGAAAVLAQTTWALPFGVLPLVLLLYPTGRPVSPRWWLAAVPAVLGILVIFVGGTVLLWPLRSHAGELLLQASEVADSPLMSATVLGGTVLLVMSVVCSVASVIVRWRRAVGIERLQLRWLVPAGFLIVAGSLLNGLLANGSAWGEIALLGGLFALPAAIAIAVLRYRLYDIERIISRVIAYALITGIVGAVYAAVVVLPSTVLNLESNVLVAAATLAAAAAFVPVRRQIQVLVDRRFNRAGYDAARVVDGFRARTRDHVDLDELITDLHDAVGLTVEPSTSSIWIAGRR